jgi:uncharacterized protein YjiS (DUF1127 family)
MSITHTNGFNEKTFYIFEKLAQTVLWIGGCLQRWAVRYIAYRERQTALAVLRRFSDRELKDIGLFRGELESAVAGQLLDRVSAARTAAIPPRSSEGSAA